MDPARGGDPPHRDSLLGRTVGRYRIDASIGSGGMGEVFLAWDAHLNRSVAVKALRPELAAEPRSRQRFVREARYACRVQHPFVCSVLDVVEDREDLFLVMEHVDGLRLDDVVERDRPSVDRVRDLAIEIAEALGAIHGAGLVHRDLKPSNVMVTADGHVKVMDFGVAQLGAHHRSPDGSDSTMTEEGFGVGTIAYMSPEQIRGRKSDARSDLFSLGIVLYQAITGEHPFDRGSPFATASAILNDPPGGGREPETLSTAGATRQIVMRLLEKEPLHRYANSDDLLRDLRAAKVGLRLSSVPKAPVWSGRRSVWATAALVVVAVGAGYAWLNPPSRNGAIPSGPPGVLVMPFAGDDDEKAPHGSMLAGLIRADLGLSDALQVVGGLRTEEVRRAVGEDDASTLNGARAALAAVGARYLVTGRWQHDGTDWVATADVFDVVQGDEIGSVRGRGASFGELAERLAADLRVSLRADARTGAPAAPVATEGALLAAERGNLALARGRLADADVAFQEALRQDPNFVRAYLERARALLTAGYVNRAKEELRLAASALEGLPSPPETLRLQLEALDGRANEDRARQERALRALTELEPLNPERWVELSVALVGARQHDEALRTIDEAVRLAPSDPIFQLQRSFVLLRMGRLDDSRMALANAARLGKALRGPVWTARLAVQRGRLAIAEEKPAEALEPFREAAAGYAEAGEPLRLAEARKLEAQALLSLGRPQEALAPLLASAKDFADAGNIHQEANTLDTLGALYLQAGAPSKAEPLLRRAVETYRRIGGDLPSVNAMLNLCSLLDATGRQAESLKLAQEAYDIAAAQRDTTRRAESIFRIGSARAGLGEFARAEADYRRILDGEIPEPSLANRTWAHGYLSNLLEAEGRPAAGLKHAEEAVAAADASKHDLNRGYARIYLARAQRLLGRLEAADRALADAAPLGASSNSDDFRRRLALERGLLASQRGDWVAAETLARSALDSAEVLSGLTAPARGLLARALASTGRPDDAIEAGKLAVVEARSHRDLVTAKADYAECLLRANRAASTAAAAQEALDLATQPPMRWEAVRAAGIRVRAGGNEPAIDAARRVGRQVWSEIVAEAGERESQAIRARRDIEDWIKEWL
jgi:tetratricopeptide (TPR) repeat protein